MTLVMGDDGLQVGTDFVDAVTQRQSASHGEMQLDGGKRLKWQSTQPIAETERAIRCAVGKEGRRLILFISQAI